MTEINLFGDPGACLATGTLPPHLFPYEIKPGMEPMAVLLGAVIIFLVLLASWR